MKRHAPAASRNSAPIAEVLRKELPQSGRVLEIASGSGEHAIYFAREFPDISWHPSDIDAAALASIDAYAQESGLDNLKPAIAVDASQGAVPPGKADAVVCINMVHISPWRASEGLMTNAAKVLGEGAPLILYGPYLEDGVETAPSNLAFDRSLKSRNPEWGLRRVSEIDALAQSQGLTRTARYAMPANNLMLVYRR